MRCELSVGNEWLRLHLGTVVTASIRLQVLPTPYLPVGHLSASRQPLPSLSVHYALSPTFFSPCDAVDGLVVNLPVQSTLTVHWEPELA